MPDESTPQGSTVVAPPPPPPPPTGTTAPMPEPREPHRRGGGTVVGIVLVLVGVGLILGRVAPHLAFWGFWPLTLIGALAIVFGIRDMFAPLRPNDVRLDRIIEGLTGVSVGVILISNSIGALDWRVWLSVFSLWPLLLVAGGLELIGKGTRTSWLQVLSSAIVLLGLWYGAFVMPVGSNTWMWPVFSSSSTESRTFEFFEPVQPGLEGGAATITGAVGRITVSDGSALASATGRTFSGEPTFDVSTSGRRARVKIESDSAGPVIFGASDPFLDVELDRNLVWDLSIESGASEMDADLSNLAVSGLLVKSGVSQASVRLGRSLDREVQVTFESGVSSLSIRVPEDVPVRIERQSGISSSNIDSGLKKVSDGWESPDFADAHARYVILLKSGISDLRVIRY